MMQDKYHYNKKALVEAFKTVGLKAGELVFCHSNVGFLGYPEEGREPETIFRIALESFFDVIGPKGTLIIPTFTFSFAKGEVFDVANTPSTVGLFTEYCRRQPQSIRSVEPMFSVAAIGPQAKDLLANISNECFGLDSIWDRMLTENAAILNIGIGIGATFIHYIEQMLKVPYRYKKLFTGEIIEQGRRTKTGVISFVRDLTYPGAFPNWQKLDKEARSSGQARISRIGKGEISLIKSRAMKDLCQAGLKKDPSFLVDGLEKKNLAAQDLPKLPLNSSSSMLDIISHLWRLPRDIISDGYDQALNALSNVLPMKIHEYPTGMECWTWIIPEKWTCREASLETMAGHKIFSYIDHPLHALSYSLPFEGIVSRSELEKHLFTHTLLPDAIPFKFKYYDRDWGLCCSQTLKDSLKDPQYKVKIKTDFSFGQLKVGEVIVSGNAEESIVLCAHLCHPAMVNDGLSGVAVGIEVMRRLKKKNGLKYTYRLLIVPETIGSIAWLSQNEDLIPKLKGGIFLEMLGIDNPLALQLSYDGNTEFDQLCIKVISEKEPDSWVGPFLTVVTNDERQFNAPGVRVPMLSLSRVLPASSPDYPYLQYHSDKDNMAITSEEHLNGSADLIMNIIDELEHAGSKAVKNMIPVNKFKGEVFFSRYGMSVERHTGPLFMIDGKNSIDDIAVKCGIPFNEAKNIIDDFYVKGLIDYKEDRNENGA